MIRSTSTLFNPFSDRTIEGIIAWAHSKGSAADISSTSKTYGVRIDLWKKTEEERTSQHEDPLSSQKAQEIFDEGYKKGVDDQRKNVAAAYKKGAHFGYIKGYRKGASDTAQKATQIANQNFEKLFREFAKECSQLQAMNTLVDQSLNSLERKIFERISRSHQFSENSMKKFQFSLSEKVNKLTHLAQDLVKYKNNKEMELKCRVSFAKGILVGAIGAISILTVSVFIKMTFQSIKKNN